MRRANRTSLQTEEAYLFFLILLVVSVPFWILGAYVTDHILPGLPVSALMFLAPAIVGGLLSLRGGVAALRMFLSQIGDMVHMPLWAWAFAILTPPLLALLSAIIQTSYGTELPPPQLGWSNVTTLFVLFLVAGIAEELGWTGYVARRLTPARGIVGTGLLIGGVSVLWHAIPLLQAERSLVWFAWWAVGSVSRRLLLTWLYVRGGYSVFGAALMHAIGNLSWMLYPSMGSHYDPMVAGLVTLAVAATLVSIDRGRPTGLAE
ncbi:MAG: CPBP family intramembrane glutamic endopeptidase [Pseudomonadota bacterium]